MHILIESPFYSILKYPYSIQWCNFDCQ